MKRTSKLRYNFYLKYDYNESVQDTTNKKITPTSLICRKTKKGAPLHFKQKKEGTSLHCKNILKKVYYPYIAKKKRRKEIGFLKAAE